MRFKGKRTGSGRVLAANVSQWCGLTQGYTSTGGENGHGQFRISLCRGPVAGPGRSACVALSADQVAARHRATGLHDRWRLRRRQRDAGRTCPFARRCGAAGRRAPLRHGLGPRFAALGAPYRIFHLFLRGAGAEGVRRRDRRPSVRRRFQSAGQPDRRCAAGSAQMDGRGGEGGRHVRRGQSVFFRGRKRRRGRSHRFPPGQGWSDPHHDGWEAVRLY